MKKINIISEAVFEGKTSAAKLAGYIPLSTVINDVFKCQPSVNADCCDVSKYFIKKAYILHANKKPKNNFLPLDQIILDVYNCCEGTELCAPKGGGVPRYWIESGQIRPKSTVETVDFAKIIKKAFACCGLTTCGC